MRFNKKTIISIVLCLAVVFMSVGYSILSTKLKVSGGANITSTWNIHVSNIETTSITGAAYNFEEPSYTDTSAKFKVMLVNPGDSITYAVTITNSGTLTGILNNISISSSGSDAIVYEVYGVKTGSTIAAGETKTLNVKVTYSSNLYADPDERVKTLNIGLEWVQYTNQVMPTDTYTVKFNANGGTCDTPTTTCTISEYEDSCVLTSYCNKTGYEHIGWSTSPDGPKVYGTYDYISNVVSPGETYNLYAVWGKITTFDYTGSYQTFTAPISGNYRLEVWGAQGGYATSTTYRGGYGGYARGEIFLEKGTTVYVIVGGQGTNGTSGTITSFAGGYNGGGQGYVHRTTVDTAAGGGGGATHMSTYTSSILRYHGNSTTALEGLLIVAGGGGGGFTDTDGYGYPFIGGAGGGATGGYALQTGSCTSNCTSYLYPSGGTQSSSGLGVTSYSTGATSSTEYVGGFGYGGTGANSYGGGGGGYYGGASGHYTGGSGGSGYIGNSNLINKYMYCHNSGCSSNSTSTSVRTYATSSTSATATAYYTKQGNGYARITQLTVQ